MGSPRESELSVEASDEWWLFLILEVPADWSDTVALTGLSASVFFSWWLTTKILESLLGDWNSFCLRFLLGFWWWCLCSWLVSWLLVGTSNVLMVILVGLSDWLTWWIFFWALLEPGGEPLELSGDVSRSSWAELSNPKQLYSLQKITLLKYIFFFKNFHILPPFVLFHEEFVVFVILQIVWFHSGFLLDTTKGFT